MTELGVVLGGGTALIGKTRTQQAAIPTCRMPRALESTDAHGHGMQVRGPSSYCRLTEGLCLFQLLLRSLTDSGRLQSWGINSLGRISW